MSDPHRTDLGRAAGSRVGFSTRAFLGEHVDRALDFALQQGFGAVEITLDHVDHPEQFDGVAVPGEAEARRLARRAGGLRTSVHASIRDIFLGDDDPAVRAAGEQNLARTVEFASALGARAVVVHLARDVDGGRNSTEAQGSDGRAIRRAGEHLQRVADGIGSGGPRIAVENVGLSARTVDSSYRELAQLLDELAHPAIGATLDVGHANARSSGSVVEAVDLLGDHICHWHLHDNDGAQDLHRSLGSGTVPLGDLRGAIGRDEEALLILEVFAKNEPDLVTALVHDRGYVEGLVA